MVVRVGAVLGTYELIELIGEGGMGAVYRARDSRLGREVAIKVIRSDLASHPDRLARFDREARLLASLNHPNIATVYGFELIDNVPFLVMELIAGETLADRSHLGPLPVKEALTIGGQIAAAMEAAHDRGVIHRDLKPSNIKITPSGSVKVLDFGLAKALHTESTAQAIAESPTLTSGATAEGLVLGTAAFMSPEQARGKPIDRRADVWAFGCTLFDMFTGRSAFAGGTISDTLSNILTRDPDWSAVPQDVPPAIRRLMRRCLEKDLSHRLRDMGDARLELEEAVEGRDETDLAPSPAVGSLRRQPDAACGCGQRVAGGWGGGECHVVDGRLAIHPRTRAPSVSRFRFPCPSGSNPRISRSSRSHRTKRTSHTSRRAVDDRNCSCVPSRRWSRCR